MLSRISRRLWNPMWLSTAVLCTLTSSPGQVTTINYFPLSGPITGVGGEEQIVAGPDGALWFTEFPNQAGKIARITTAGQLTEYSLPAQSMVPIGITAGPDGALWFTEYNFLVTSQSGEENPTIGRITTGGVITEYPLGPATGGALRGPRGITVGPDGALWFVQVYSGSIGRITVNGVFSEYPLPAIFNQPGIAFGSGAITKGPDNALWFTVGDNVGRITTAGAITRYPLSTSYSLPGGITTGPDGALWFSEGNIGKIGRITTDGSLTEYNVSTGLPGPGITVGPDGALWSPGGQFIVRITTSGVVSKFFQDYEGVYIAAGPDGNLWFTSYEPWIGQVVLALGPVTVASVNGPMGNNNWYLGAVTVTLAATDVSSPISASYYSLDGNAYQTYVGPFAISSAGVHQLLFYSVDTANRQETPHTQTIKVDAPPVSRVAALASPAASPNFLVQWSGTDATSGLLNYSIYYSDNGGPFKPWITQTTSTSSWFAGYLGHTYGFYSSGLDVAGNVEVKTVADTFTVVPASMPEDVNGDGQINCLDLDIVKVHLGATRGQANYLPAADVNNDGVINVLDMALVAQKMIPGTKCP